MPPTLPTNAGEAALAVHPAPFAELLQSGLGCEATGGGTHPWLLTSLSENVTFPERATRVADAGFLDLEGCASDQRVTMRDAAAVLSAKDDVGCAGRKIGAELYPNESCTTAELGRHDQGAAAHVGVLRAWPRVSYAVRIPRPPSFATENNALREHAPFARYVSAELMREAPLPEFADASKTLQPLFGPARKH